MASRATSHITVMDRTKPTARVAMSRFMPTDKATRVPSVRCSFSRGLCAEKPRLLRRDDARIRVVRLSTPGLARDRTSGLAVASGANWPTVSSAVGAFSERSGQGPVDFPPEHADDAVGLVELG